MAKKRLQKKREAARTASAKIETTKKEPLKVTTKKVEPLKVETRKVEPVKVETSKTEPIKVETTKTEPVKVETAKTEPVKVEAAPPVPEIPARNDDGIYKERLARHLDELKWLYCELYQDNPYVTTHLNDLLKVLKKFYDMRNNDLKESDLQCTQNPEWYSQNSLTGMTMYVDSFAKDLKEMESRLNYIQKCNINCLHLMNLLDSRNGSDNKAHGISDFRKIHEDLGTMDDLAQLIAQCHAKGIHVCLDLSLNHTSDDHEWARRARNGEKEYQDRYFFFDNYDLPSLYDQTCPETFPTAAPGNFTWLEDIHKHVMTTFHENQWDLNYRNPLVLNEMIFHILYLADQGVDVIQLNDISCIWKQIGTDCRDLPQIHTILRILRMVCEIVCPGVLLLSEVHTTPENAASYFGTEDKPECHLIDNTAAMADIWHTVATRNVSLLRHQMDKTAALSGHGTFVNHLRTEDSVSWDLDYSYLSNFGVQETPHKEYLNDFLTGKYPDSFARGELYISDPALNNPQLCGTTASLCGIERFGFEGDEAGMERAVRYDITLHAFLLSQSGIPVIYSGDELGQVNDYSYKKDPEKSADARYLHKGTFQWNLTDNCSNPESVQGRIFPALDKLEHTRSSHSVFNSNAAIRTLDTWDDSVLAFVRENDTEKFIGIYNFSENDKVAWINEEDGLYTDLFSNRELEAKGVQLPAFGFCWLCRKK